MNFILRLNKLRRGLDYVQKRLENRYEKRQRELLELVKSNSLILGPGKYGPAEPGSEEEEGYASIVIIKIVRLYTKNAPHILKRNKGSSKCE